MSRCFPYLPPGYVRSDCRGVALIKSIEVQRENEKAKSELKKEKKRQRQEKRKDKKERKKGKSYYISDDAIAVKKLSGEKLCDVEKSRYDMNGGCISKGKEEEAERLERSNLTEEHGMPVSSQSTCCLSDGSQSSKKRKASSEGSDHHGNIVRIKLNLLKHKEPDAIVSGEQSCSTSGMVDSHVQYEENKCVRDQEQWSCTKQSVAGLEKEKCRLGLVEVPGLKIRPKSSQNEMQKTESLYGDLIQEWLPSPVELKQESLDDQDWLFRVRRQNGTGFRRIATSRDVARCRSPTLWPRAHYLHEADVFALPFTVPF